MPVTRGHQPQFSNRLPLFLTCGDEGHILGCSPYGMGGTCSIWASVWCKQGVCCLQSFSRLACLLSILSRSGDLSSDPTHLSPSRCEAQGTWEHHRCPRGGMGECCLQTVTVCPQSPETGVPRTVQELPQRAHGLMEETDRIWKTHGQMEEIRSVPLRSLRSDEGYIALPWERPAGMEGSSQSDRGDRAHKRLH